MQTSATARPTIREIPGRSDAEMALAAALASGRPTFLYADLFLPEHVAEILDIGDYRTADEALLAACQSLAHQLPPGARLFRWSATAVLVIGEGEPRPAFPAKHRRVHLGEAPSCERLCRELDLYVARNLW